RTAIALSGCDMPTHYVIRRGVDSVPWLNAQPRHCADTAPSTPAASAEVPAASALQDSGDALTAGCADGDQTTSGTVLGQQFRQRGGDPTAGGGERVPGSDGRAVHVQFRLVDRTRFLVAAAPVLGELGVLPGFQRGQHLRGERLVDLVEVEVLQGQP